MTRRLSVVPDAPRRMVAYVRVSALMGRAGESFHSPELQVQAIEALAARTGAMVVEVVQDIDVSGRGFAREGLDRVLALARAKEVDSVGLYDLSRLGRNTGEALRCIATLRDFGVSVASTVEQIDDSPEGQFMLGQFLGMAQLYSDQIGRRWQQVIDKRARQGLWHGSIPPLGYRRGEHGLEVDPVLGPLVADCFVRYAAGERLADIRHDLTIKRGGATIRPNYFKRVLRNPVYRGLVRHGGQDFPGRHPRLVDDVTWARVSRRLDADARVPTRTLAVSHSLIGLVVCDECGDRLQLHREPDRAPWLQCRRAMDSRRARCQGVGSPRQELVELAVREQLLGLVEGLQVDPERQARKAQAGADAGRLKRELAKTEQALARLTVDHARREVSVTAYRLASEELERAGEALRVQIEELRTVADLPAPRVQARQAKALLKAWDALSVDEQNRGLRALLAQVRVRKAVHRSEPMSDRVEVIPLA